jgi:tetratricopeptide (TPR) repeat protein
MGDFKIKMSLIAFCFIICFSVQSLAAVTVSRSNLSKDGEIVAVRGEGHVMFVRDSNWIEAVASQALTSGDTLKTGSHGKLDVLFIDGVQIKVHHNTTLVIKDVAKNKKGTLLGLKSGEVWSRAKAVPGGLKIETPSATAAIRGTDWDIVVDDKGTSYLTVLNGNVELFNDFGSVKVNAGEQAMAEVGKTPVKVFLVRPKDRIQWIISYSLDFTRLISFHTYTRDEAISLLPSERESLKNNPDDLNMKLRLAGLLFDLRQTDESLNLFNEALIKEPENSKALIFKGLILLGKGETDRAEQLFKQALKTAQTSDMINASIGLAGVYLYRNDIKEAEKTLTQIGNEKSPVIGLALAQFNAYRGDFRKAVQICEQYAVDYPKDERFHILAADFHLTLDEPDKANESLNKALSINQNSSEAHALLGRYHYLAGRAKQSEDAFRKSIEVNPNNTNAISELGKLLMDKGEFEESLKKHNKAVQLNPNANSYLSRRGMLLNWLEDIKGAEKDYKKALDITSSDYQSLDGLGFLALKEGRTKEAIQYFNKASLLEPKFAEPHIFLAIAYYQQENMERALEELRLAELLDPKDPLPHIIAYLIHQDTYRPFEAIKEATLALELLPNLKSVSPIETTQKGTTNLGSALLGLGLTEWATSYAEESFNQYDVSSYIFNSIKYKESNVLYLSTLVQGLLLNPMAHLDSDRYYDIVMRPQHNLKVNTTFGSEGGAFYRNSEAVQQGYIRNPWEIIYAITLENSDNKGFRDNGFERSNSINYGIGIKPDYKNSLFILGNLKNTTSGDPGPVSYPYADNNTKNAFNMFLAGYNYRIGTKNNIFLHFSYVSDKDKIRWLDPFGTMNTNTVLMRTGPSEFIGYQFKHIITISDNHDVSYGIEYVPRVTIKFDDIYSIGTYSWSSYSKLQFNSSFLYINDRWRLSDNFLAEAGIAYEAFKENTSGTYRKSTIIKDGGIHPRIGFSWKLNRAHIFYAAYQKKLFPTGIVSLAPMSTAGTFFEWQSAPTAIYTDYHARLESRWNERIFTSLSLEKRDVKNTETFAAAYGKKNATNFISAALNAILNDRLGAFVRYKYADSEIKDGLYTGKALPLLPHHTAGAGLVWVSPSYLKAMLSTYYIAGQYGDNKNTYKLPDYWTTNFEFTWETLKKHLMLKIEAKNIFDSKYETKQGYPAAGRSVYLTAEYRF